MIVFKSVLFWITLMDAGLICSRTPEFTSYTLFPVGVSAEVASYLKRFCKFLYSDQYFIHMDELFRTSMIYIGQRDVPANLAALLPNTLSLSDKTGSNTWFKIAGACTTEMFIRYFAYSLSFKY